MTEVKPGYKTTEFYLAVFSALVGFLVLSGAVPGLDQATGDAATDAVTQVVEGVVALITILGPIIGYTASRAKVKAAAEYGGTMMLSDIVTSDQQNGVG